MTEALRFWALIEVIGLGAAPLAGVVLARLPGAGLGLGKALGLLLVTWLIWLGGSTTLIPYGTLSAALWIALVCALGLLAWVRGWEGRRAVARGEPEGRIARWRWRRLAARVPQPDPLRARLFWGAEAVFLVAFVVMALVVSFAPDVWNTEKPMDMAFLNASNRAETFPPHDPWLAGADLNYYYLGQLAMGILVKLTAVAPDHGYNLSLAALFALTAAAVFTLAGTAVGRDRTRPRRAARRARRRRPGRGGGQPGGRAAADRRRRPARRLRLVRGLARVPRHDHRVPVVLVPARRPARARARAAVHAARAGVRAAGVLAGPRLSARGWFEGAVAALATAFLYAVNSWSYPVMAGLLVLAVVAWLRDPRSEGSRPAAVRWVLLVLAGGVLLVLPFHLSFDPAARGLGVVEDGRGFAGWAKDELLVFGTLLALVAVAYAARLLATARPLRNGAWILVAALFAGSLLAALGWAHAVLLAALLVAALWALLSDRMTPPERLVWLLVCGGVACLLGPEVLYIRDEFDGSDLYRMNTVFKLDYQAWLLLGLAGIGALAHWRAWLRPRALRLGFAALIALVAVAGAVYPIAGTYARTGRLRAQPDARRARLAARPRARRRRRDRLAQRPRRRQPGRARGGRRRLRRVRARPDLDVHRAADDPRLARPRAPVGP